MVSTILGMTLSHNRILIFLSGVFGWTCTPAAFQVVTRALLFYMNHKLIGKVLIYVDDIMGVCLRKDSNLFDYNGGHGQSQNHMHRPPGPNRRRYRDYNVV